MAIRFVLPLLALLALIAYSAIPLFEALDRRWATRDVEVRARLIANTMSEAMAPLIAHHDEGKINRFFERAVQDDRLYGIGFCDLNGKLLYRSSVFPTGIRCDDPKVYVDSVRSLHIGDYPMESDGAEIGRLILVHDMGFVGNRSTDTKRYLFWLFVILGLLISLVNFAIAKLSWDRLYQHFRSALRGEPIKVELNPIAKEMRDFLRETISDRSERDEEQISWTPQALKSILKEELAGDEVLIVSNREPYIHSYVNGKIEIKSPASGLVTALEPVMRACSGTWIAHGGGSADRETVDQYDRVRVPPNRPSYQIRRVWLSEDEERGYYYGFSNEGLWPLCHNAYARPIFRSSDWDQYRIVNEKFAEAVIKEARTDDPVILVQDYHLALLPRLIKKRLPNATIITFWHIPWPNAETFGICPWQEEILEGLLGSSILGFHTRFHCNNFIESVDRFLEARIDRETSQISFRNKKTAIKSYPISIEWPVSSEFDPSSVNKIRDDLRSRNGLPLDSFMAVGVDRLDYTKGIIERFLAVERLLERKPEWVGKFSLVQIAAPSRSQIESYKAFERQVLLTAEKINQRFPNAIVLRIEHHSSDQVFDYFRACDVCMVTSLHDGMNLVAKEFVAAREDKRGVLILSQFTGAARELRESLIVNPYDIDQCAAALHAALSMSGDEQMARMRSMRATIQEFNVYRWAGRMLIDAARMRRFERLFEKTQEAEVWH